MPSFPRCSGASPILELFGIIHLVPCSQSFYLFIDALFVRPIIVFMISDDRVCILSWDEIGGKGGGKEAVCQIFVTIQIYKKNL